MNTTNRQYFEECITAMITNSEFVKEYVFYSSMIAQCKIQFEDIPAPAGVSFNDTYYILYINNDIFGKYPLEHRIGILKHEMLHILNNHVQRNEGKNQNIWNIATDMAINQLIKREHLPDEGIHITDFENTGNEGFKKLLSSEIYYELLKDNEDNEDNEGQSLDRSPDHSTWEKSVGNIEVQNNVTKKMIETSIEKSFGNVSKDILNSLKLFQNKAKVNWRRALKNLTAKQRTGSMKTIQKLDRRFPTREELKGNKKNYKFNLLVLLDVSGSMKNQDILLGLSEIYNICKLNKTDMKLIQIDTEIKGVKGIENYSPKNKLFTRKGNGGTKIFPAIEYIKNKKLNLDGIIIITDGCCEDISQWEFTPKCKTIFLGGKPNGFDKCKNKKYSYYPLK
jgi:predicted metal-dependent peptidase